MSADFNPLDTTQRGKVTGGIQELLNAGLSLDQIMQMYRNVRGESDALLKQRYGALQYTLGQPYQGYEADRARMAGDPIYGSTGYGAALDRNAWGDVMGRLSSGYMNAANEQTGQDINFLSGLYGQRAGAAANLQGQGYQSFFGLPRKQTTGDKALQFGGQALGSAVGALAGGGGPAAAAAGAGGAPSALGYLKVAPGTTPMSRYSEASTVLRRPGMWG